jgi:hypothetical protein
MMPSPGEAAGASAEFIEQEEAIFAEMGVGGLPGLGESAEADAAHEHRYCPKCGKLELRPGQLQNRHRLDG